MEEIHIKKEAAALKTAQELGMAVALPQLEGANKCSCGQGLAGQLVQTLREKRDLEAALGAKAAELADTHAALAGAKVAAACAQAAAAQAAKAVDAERGERKEAQGSLVDAAGALRMLADADGGVRRVLPGLIRRCGRLADAPLFRELLTAAEEPDQAAAAAPAAAKKRGAPAPVTRLAGGAEKKLKAAEPDEAALKRSGRELAQGATQGAAATAAALQQISLVQLITFFNFPVLTLAWCIAIVVN